MAYTTIKKPSDYFNTNLYTGNNTETSHTGIGFQPDLTWLKVRNASGAHYWFDAVRGATNYIRSDNTAAEGTIAETLKSFDSDGYTVGTSNSVNTNGETMVGWNWLGANGTAANTDGSISSTVSASTTSGFSIVTYDGTGSAGATVGHGLGVAPSMILAKKMDGAASNWAVYHKSLGATKYLILNSTTASVTSNTRWNNVEPTSSVFTVGSSGDVNNNGETVVAYCFAEKKGYSKFGSYTGNGNADGTFVYTGFSPAFIIVKRTDGADHWTMYDNKRTPYNVNPNRLFPSTNGAESTADSSYNVDLLSNGFKWRGTSTGTNTSGTYIYMAIAEEPLVGDNPATAR